MPNLTQAESKERFSKARVARLATVGADGQPHVVVFVFAMQGDRIVHAIDQKPKQTMALKRIANIKANPRVSVLVDHYTESWEDLWWVRADGIGRILDDDRPEPVRLLMEKYEQYRERPPMGPVIAVDVTRWTGWSFSALDSSDKWSRRGHGGPDTRVRPED